MDINFNKNEDHNKLLRSELRKRLDIDKSAAQLARFFDASIELMQVMARACGHDHLNQFNKDDLATWHREMALLSGVKFSGLLEAWVQN